MQYNDIHPKPIKITQVLPLSELENPDKYKYIPPKSIQILYPKKINSPRKKINTLVNDDKTYLPCKHCQIL